MDELRLNKLFAAFLFAALLLMAGIKIADIMVPHQKLAQNSYVIEVAETTSLTAAAPVETGPEPILAMLAGADLGAGETLSKKCSACHVFEAGGKNKVDQIKSVLKSGLFTGLITDEETAKYL